MPSKHGVAGSNPAGEAKFSYRGSIPRGGAKQF